MWRLLCTNSEVMMHTANLVPGVAPQHVFMAYQAVYMQLGCVMQAVGNRPEILAACISLSACQRQQRRRVTLDALHIDFGVAAQQCRACQRLCWCSCRLSGHAFKRVQPRAHCSVWWLLVRTSRCNTHDKGFDMYFSGVQARGTAQV
jgi:hypothetical protein